VPARFPVLVLVLAAVALPAAPAGAAPKQGKDFSMSVESPVYAGVTDAAYEITLTNRTDTQQLGSANIRIPEGFTLVDAAGNPEPDDLIELRNLNLAADAPPLTVSVGLRMPCEGGTYDTWEVEAKQSNDFSGAPGNSLTQVGATPSTTVLESCRLRFVDADEATSTPSGQPASAEIGEAVRAVAFDPDSDRLITVEAVDGSPTAGLLDWFDGGVSVTSVPGGFSSSSSAAGGVATFSDLVIPVSGNYRLEPAATDAAGFDGEESDPFQVIEVVVDCKPGQCFAQREGAKTKTTLTGSPTTGSGLALLSLNLGPDPLSAPGCSTYTPPGGSPDYYEFQLFGIEAASTVVLEYSKESMRRRTPASLEVCFAVPGPAFTAKDGLPADTFDYDGLFGPGSGGFADLLANCPPTPVQPCVLGRNGTTGGGALITFYVPEAWSGDPRYH
jgi:hypothetical protein